MAKTATRHQDGQLSKGCLEYIIRHVFLPPRLPQEDDFKPEYQVALIQLTTNALKNFQDFVTPESQHRTVAAWHLLQSIKQIHVPTGEAHTRGLISSFETIGSHDIPGGHPTQSVYAPIAINVHAQNAGIFISPSKDAVCFEAFELSPTNRAAMSTKGRLRRHFPAQAVRIDHQTFRAPGFQKTVSETLATMSQERVNAAVPKVKKAGQWHQEDRDTCDPMVVTQLFMAFLGSLGEIKPAIAITKHTREEVQYTKGRSPWRRSSMWLLIRVALQMHFTRAEPGSRLYKAFMIFFMGSILGAATNSDISTDEIYCMQAKIVRRRLKFGPTIPESIEYHLRQIEKETEKLLVDRWQQVQNLSCHRLDLASLRNLDVERDTWASLPDLDRYLQEIRLWGESQSKALFTSSRRLLNCTASELPTLQAVDIADDGYKNMKLLQFEQWISIHLAQWAETQAGENACAQLQQSLIDYYGLAKIHYAGNPEGLSVAILTCMQIWMACDILAIRKHRLLSEYDPQIAEGLLQNLLLPFFQDMQTLQKIENYLQNRTRQARYRAFSSISDPNCFAARFFDQSPSHQALHDTIDSWATRMREEKKDELAMRKEQYAKLQRLVNESECEYHVVWKSERNFLGELFKWEETEHKPGCERCRYSDEATRMKIAVHEWPLPRNRYEAKVVVFELQVPPAFAAWRDTTMYLLTEILCLAHVPAHEPDNKFRLAEDRHLHSWFSSSANDRVGLLSEVKPHVVTHRFLKEIMTTNEPEVCVASGVRYMYFDSLAGCFMEDFGLTEDMPHDCTYRLPLEAKELQRFIFRPANNPGGPPPNAVIASQSNCPISMSLDEYQELGTLALGNLIQWWTILGHLAAPSVDLKKPETALVMWQCIHQTGPPSDRSLRQNHADLEHENMVSKLLEVLHEALARTRGNWESASALSILATIATRMLSLNSAAAVKQPTLDFLEEAREVCFGWIYSLQSRAKDAATDDERTDLMSISNEVALVGISCFDVEDVHLRHILVSPRQTAILIRMAMVLWEGRVALSFPPGSLFHILHWRFQRLQYRSYRHISRDSQGLDEALRQTWSAYSPSGDWKVVSAELDYWLTSHMQSTDGGFDFTLHYDLLTAELLVDGNPLGKLPKEYEASKLYSMLFGRSAIETIPSKAPGMKFTLKHGYRGFDVHLALDDNTNLRVRASRENQLWFMVPPEVFHGIFPTHFLEEYVHWYDYNHNTILFRPTCNPWNISRDYWTLHYGGNTEWQLRNEGDVLAPLETQTSETICNMLAPLALGTRIHIFLKAKDQLVAIDIPKLKLNFSLRIGESSLRSKQFPNHYVDKEQNIGSVFGLNNKLVLQHETNGGRIVLMPEGPVSYTRDISLKHVRVSVDVESATTIHSFRVDNLLHRLRDSGSLRSAFFLAYLHALTSFCLPDPLTQKTGTEQAISILTSPAIMSHEKMAQEDADLLSKIADLSPKRKYYPENERSMQSVKWSDSIGYLSQYSGFYQIVQSIFDQERFSHIFNPENTLRMESKNTDLFLLERDCIRSSSFRVDGFGAEAFTCDHDSDYSARDQGYSSTQRADAYAMCRLIYRRENIRHWLPSSAEALWAQFSQLRVLDDKNASKLSGAYSIRYSGELLGSEYQLFPLWLSFHRKLAVLREKEAERYHVMLWLASLVFSGCHDIGVLQILALCYCSSDIWQISIPKRGSFSPIEGKIAILDDIRKDCRHALRGFSSSPENQLTRPPLESHLAFERRRQRSFQSKRDRTRDSFANAIFGQWPCSKPRDPNMVSTDFAKYMNTKDAMSVIRARFEIWHDNHSLYQQLRDLTEAAENTRYFPIDIICGSLKACDETTITRRFVSIGELFAQQAPDLTGVQKLSRTDLAENRIPLSCPRLEVLLQRLREKRLSTFEQAYLRALDHSSEHLQQRGVIQNDPGLWNKKLLEDHYQQCKIRVDDIYGALLQAVQPDIPKSCAPRISHVAFLELLEANNWRNLRADWRQCAVMFASALVALQRAKRIMHAYTAGDHDAMAAEIRNIPHQNWDPMEYPDSLLLEVESCIVIRRVQEDIAEQMRAPPLNRNTVMQLNMGEGKSSVIIPMLIAALANGIQLVLVVVPKPQMKQMAYVLRSKLSGLLRRRIFYMPFSRALQLDLSDITAITSALQVCMRQGGVVLLQPEHILSFELMALDCRLREQLIESQALWNTQELLKQHARYVVDESDEIYNVKFELVYTIGAHSPIEMSPHRWTVIQQVLGLVRTLAYEIYEKWPTGISIMHHKVGGFPRVRILSREAGADLFDRIATRICETGLQGLPLAHQPSGIRQLAREYITLTDLSPEQAEPFERSTRDCFWTESAQNTLLLLRGLIACGVLSFAFSQKRWRVHYGLALQRVPSTRLAVPYRAKDTPAPRSEFSHPDVLIVLSSLCYYYRGLSNEELLIALGHLKRSNQRDLEYAAWLEDAPNVPVEFAQLQGINLHDRQECQRLFDHLRYAKSVVDYYLSKIVFPKEMQVFPYKLSASGWDLGRIKRLPTTGFSGTNDARKLLPLDVHYLDQDAQTFTNAFVLHNLLQSSNSVKLLEQRDHNRDETDAEHLLSTIMSLEKPVQVILDAGAQILELDNHEVAQTWLQMQPSEKFQGALYFDVHDELMVIDRHGDIEPFLTSSFATRLGSCLVYLDQAHTRGTDLKLPPEYRAAVTLGANLTKDALVQACMRMRKLDKGQSVTFCVPSEIEIKIRECTSISPDEEIKVADVLFWAIGETFTDIKRNIAIWKVQGERFERQQQILEQAPHGESPPSSLVQQLLEDETQSLKERYGVYNEHEAPPQVDEHHNRYSARIADRCAEFENLRVRLATLAEEQERELAPEVEEEREIQRPPPARAAKHSLHLDLTRFVQEGTLMDNSKAYVPAFQILRNTSAAANFDPSALSCRRLLATTDFAKTVEEDPISFQSDSYQRSIRWILTAREPGSCEVSHAVLISPYEADKLIRMIWGSKFVSMSLYKPCSNLAYRALDDLTFATVPSQALSAEVPRSLAISLGLFAGQLYLRSYDHYIETCARLGLATKQAAPGWEVAADGFVIRDAQGHRGAGSGLETSPVPFLKALFMRVRRHGDNIAMTPMGRLLEGILLLPNEFKDGVGFEAE